MSTYIYLVCDSHSSPIRADEESGQHLYDLPAVRFNWLMREHWHQYIDRFPDALTREWDNLSYFDRNTWRFLREHRHCGVPRVVSEYGGTYSIEARTVGQLLSEHVTYA